MPSRIAHISIVIRRGYLCLCCAFRNDHILNTSCGQVAVPRCREPYLQRPMPADGRFAAGRARDSSHSCAKQRSKTSHVRASTNSATLYLESKTVGGLEGQPTTSAQPGSQKRPVSLWGLIITSTTVPHKEISGNFFLLIIICRRLFYDGATPAPWTFSRQWRRIRSLLASGVAACACGLVHACVLRGVLLLHVVRAVADVSSGRTGCNKYAVTERGVGEIFHTHGTTAAFRAKLTKDILVQNTTAAVSHSPDRSVNRLPELAV